MNVAMLSVQLPINGTFQPSLAWPLAICASSGPIPYVRITSAPASLARSNCEVMSVSPMLNFSVATGFTPFAASAFSRSSRPSCP